MSIILGAVLQILVAAGSVTTTDASGYTTSTPGPVSVVGYVLEGVWFLATIVPQLALLDRRLHDAGISARNDLHRARPIPGRPHPAHPLAAASEARGAALRPAHRLAVPG